MVILPIIRFTLEQQEISNIYFFLIEQELFEKKDGCFFYFILYLDYL
jgi:hypothetical protein